MLSNIILAEFVLIDFFTHIIFPIFNLLFTDKDKANLTLPNDPYPITNLSYYGFFYFLYLLL